MDASTLFHPGSDRECLPGDPFELWEIGSRGTLKPFERHPCPSSHRESGQSKIFCPSPTRENQWASLWRVGLRGTRDRTAVWLYPAFLSVSARLRLRQPDGGLDVRKLRQGQTLSRRQGVLLPTLWQVLPSLRTVSAKVVVRAHPSHHQGSAGSGAVLRRVPAMSIAPPRLLRAQVALRLSTPLCGGRRGRHALQSLLARRRLGGCTT